MVKTNPPKSNLPKSQPQTLSSRADLIFPVRRIGRMLHKIEAAKKISIKSAIMMTGALEYIVAEVLDASVEAATLTKKTRIDPKVIVEGIRSDHELSMLFHSKWILTDVKKKTWKTQEVMRDEENRVSQKLKEL